MHASPPTRPLWLAILVGISLCAVPSLLTGQKEDRAQGTVLKLEAHAEPELATYMGTLQTYVHKLALSIDAENPKLAAFYAYESIVFLEKIQEDVPEYRNIPVALYIDRMALEPLKALETLLKAKAPEFTKIEPAMDAVIQSCNLCHASTDTSFIKIKRNKTNPFLQDFSK